MCLCLPSGLSAEGGRGLGSLAELERKLGVPGFFLFKKTPKGLRNLTMIGQKKGEDDDFDGFCRFLLGANPSFWGSVSLSSNGKSRT